MLDSQIISASSITQLVEHRQRHIKFSMHFHLVACSICLNDGKMMTSFYKHHQFMVSGEILLHCLVRQVLWNAYSSSSTLRMLSVIHTQCIPEWLAMRDSNHSWIFLLVCLVGWRSLDWWAMYHPCYTHDYILMIAARRLKSRALQWFKMWARSKTAGIESVR